jgi:NAD(P)-dependent dehydrogenase (short-subunit alcohol dehydrogenase family)
MHSGVTATKDLLAKKGLVSPAVRATKCFRIPRNTKEKVMESKVVLITGALTGIGRATAIAFAKQGASVVVSGRRDEEGKKLAAELRGFGGEAEFIMSDVRHEDEVRNLVEKTVARFGRLDIAVNNAGTEGQPGLIVDQTPETLAATFETNVLGTLLSMKYEIRAMQAQQKGSIVNISSSFGRTGAASASVYSASKHAVEGLTKSAALELAGSGIRVNIVAPGPVETGMLNRFTGTEEIKARLAAGVPMKRVGRPEEIAEAIIFVSSDQASFITGARIAVDGGKAAG